MHSRVSKAAFEFDPTPYREVLCAVIREIEAAAADVHGHDQDNLPRPVLDRILRRYPRDGRGFFSRSELIAGYRAFAGSEGFALDEASFVARVQMRPVRTQSGVTPVTVLTKPFPCPGQCVFCPNDVRMPKSYLSAEPGCQRAEANGFDPYLQTYQRLRAFRAIGHPTEKAELIVLGGTFSYYPESYRLWFIKRCFDALNDFGSGRDGCASAEAHSLSVAELRDVVDGSRLGQPMAARAATYNRVVTHFLRQREQGSLTAAFEHASWDELRAAQAENERARTRNVGLVLETRPDHIDLEEIIRLRRLGCTKVQLGFQSLSDHVLSANKRGHDVAAIRRATGMLRAAGFKILAHLMPNLLAATPASDMEDIARLFDDPGFRPDELKLYPCSLIETAELMRYYHAGEYQPYEPEQLLSVVCEALRRAPRYCRLARVIRDISSGDIVAGNRVSNLREVAEQRLRAEGVALMDIRSREIKRRSLGEARLRVTEYVTSISEERFIELVTDDDALLGFCRLSLPLTAATTSGIAELQGSALIRELHVYGASLALGQAPGGDAQHRGYGTRLLTEAAQLAAANGFRDLAVISAVGTRAYYRARGFLDAELYQHLPLPLRPV
jgi:elongator complex protein 3